jgi:succinylglutamic semialdehyde dehydrogenase
MDARGNYIDGQWRAARGVEFTSLDPATGQPTWSGRGSSNQDVNGAVEAARRAFESWGDLLIEKRAELLRRFGEHVKARRADLIEAICRSTGKPRWEAGTEVDTMVGKVALTIEAQQVRRSPTEKEIAGAKAATRYKPHGVVAVFGPFNFPGHLPNGHILPALLAGNTVIFKPSEQTPLVGQHYAEIMSAAGAPAGVFNLVQGGRETGAVLASHEAIDGLFFTGSFEAGVALSRASVENPGRILALEMGGNSPLVVHRVSNLEAAAYWTVQGAFITAGQRCSCARRLIVLRDREGDAFLDRLFALTRTIRVGRYTDEPEPFMGPVINETSARRLMDAQRELVKRGARPLVEMRQLGDRATMLSPGMIDVTDVDRSDVELFGPLLQVIRVSDFDAAIREANRTRYGLVSALFSDDRALWDEFYRRARAGVINWNRPTTGASGALPFGGIGRSGNHRPSAYFAADYSSYPVALMEAATLELPKQLTRGIVL